MRISFILHLARRAWVPWDWHLLDHSMHWDERMHAFFGLAPSTFSGRYEQFLEMIDAENRQQVAREFAQALERRAEYDGEFRVVWPTIFQFRLTQDQNATLTPRSLG
jgi:hypothetical protein